MWKREHVGEDRRMIGQDTLVNAKLDVLGNENNRPIFVPKLWISFQRTGGPSGLSCLILFITSSPLSYTLLTGTTHNRSWQARDDSILDCSASLYLSVMRAMGVGTISVVSVERPVRGSW